ncbi:MAG: hypothetical protein ACOH1X_02825 [Kaistella sp.]
MKILTTYMYILLVSAIASVESSQIGSLFTDVIFVVILISGIGISLTMDEKRPDIKRTFSITYLVFSVCASIFFSVLVIAAYIDFNFSKFYFYLLIGATATLAPKFASAILPEMPAELKKGVFSLLGAIFRGAAKKFDNSDTPTNDYNNNENINNEKDLENGNN